VIAMGNRLRSYLAKMESIDPTKLSTEEKEALIQDLLIQIGFFQHERLIHLIVTVLFALVTVMAVLCSCLTQNLVLIALILAFLVLLVPYIMHYYLLENGVQKLYTYYDKFTA
jgi:hypothetical protein